ncbi:prephenate dehydratase [Pontibacillus halophilus JSM 076056 = DSM 19796]|uniref:Prephenate dehydratase n=1 Tax=Pontibacillus halophilus JSM 076056 = DSM 19796 TaxID=1385510 RepID=A0A0A5GNI4_9BACI|nr:prephenate dehydratase [Pontibacillus halophilus]KGX93494.1 prephenate dehydratase [Pontibacillus halophilus JSM 076056 = DSM 19796]
MSKVGYLGPKGTFTHQAVHALFDQHEFLSYRTIPECLDAVEKGEIDVGVVPLENTIEGTVHLTIDYLIHHVDLPIVAEADLPIEQHLLVPHSFDGDLSKVEAIYSHSHAVAQCHQFIHHQCERAEVEYSTSTGEAARMVNEKGGNIAAIGNRQAAEEYGLKVLRENIHDYPNNHTRFAVVQKGSEPIEMRELREVNRKTTISVTLPSDYAGALHQVLSAFSWRRMNLSKIESRPMKTGLGNYFFIIDVDQPYDGVLFPGVQAELQALGCDLKVLGTYPCFHLATASSKEATTD